MSCQCARRRQQSTCRRQGAPGSAGGMHCAPLYLLVWGIKVGLNAEGHDLVGQLAEDNAILTHHGSDHETQKWRVA